MSNESIIRRLLVLNPCFDSERAYADIAALSTDAGWRPLAYDFNIPQTYARSLWTVAQSDGDVFSSLDHWLLSIGVTDAVVGR